MIEVKPNNLDDAILAFKKLGIEILKQSKNTFFKDVNGNPSKYADLPTILDSIEKPLADFGVRIKSYHHQVEGGAWVETTELRFKGEIESSSFPIFGNKPQEMGSSITYARRFNIQSLLNLAAQDDDGNSANKAEPIKTTPVIQKTIFWNTAKERTNIYNAIMKELNDTKNLDDLAATWVSRSEHLAALKASDAQIFAELESRKNTIKEAFKQIEV